MHDNGLTAHSCGPASGHRLCNRAAAAKPWRYTAVGRRAAQCQHQLPVAAGGEMGSYKTGGAVRRADQRHGVQLCGEQHCCVNAGFDVHLLVWCGSL